MKSLKERKQSHMKTATAKLSTTGKCTRPKTTFLKAPFELNALMNQRLADAVDLQTQIKQAHWNVKGPHFIGLHELFDQIDEAVDLTWI